MKIIFTGAGLSRNWGGFLAKDVAGLLVSHPNFSDRVEMREWLLRKGNYEQAIAEMRRRKPEWEDAVNDALIDVFTQHDRLLCRSRGAVNNAQFLHFLNRALHESGTQPFYVFTTNQDLLLERMIVDPVAPPSMPGINRHQAWFKPNMADFTDALRVNVDDAPVSRPSSGFHYVKLHGSFDWRIGGRPVLIAGEDKQEAIRGSKLLTSYHQMLRQALKCEPVDVLFIGYSFSDPYINAAFRQELHARSRYFIIDPQPMNEWTELRIREDFGQFVYRTHGYWPWTLKEIFPPGNSMSEFTPFYEDIVRAFLQ